MGKRFLYLAGALCYLLAMGGRPAEAGEPANAGMQEEIRIIEQQARDVSIPRSFGSSPIRGWSVLDNRNILIEVSGRKQYQATFYGDCPGIRFTAFIALSTMGPFALDKTSTVILPDGMRCAIKRLVPYTAAEDGTDE